MCRQEAGLPEEVDDIEAWVDSWPSPPERSYQLKELLDLAGMNEADGAQADGLDITVTGVACDSRKVQPGNIFVCLNGSTANGHDYASEAVDAGAAAVIAQPDKLEGMDLGVSVECRLQLIAS